MYRRSWESAKTDAGGIRPVDALHYASMKFRKRISGARVPGDSITGPVSVVRRLDTPGTARTRKSGSYDAMGNRLLKVAVVVLCTVNALMWEYYTESRMMAILWAAVAVGFIVWIIDDTRR